MTKAELINELAEKADLSKALAERTINALADITASELKAGNQVVLPGIGKLDLSHRPARTGRNPQTGDPVHIEASNGVKFKAAKQLKDAVN